MAELHSGKNHSKITELLSAMVGHHNIHEASQNLSQLQDHSTNWSDYFLTYRTGPLTTSDHHHGHLYNVHHHQHEWPGHSHHYNALTQCLPLDSLHHHDTSSKYQPIVQSPETVYGRCSTPDIIQSVLKMEPNEVSPIGRTSTGHASFVTLTPITPKVAPNIAIWKSPGKGEYMDSGYISEDSLSMCAHSAENQVLSGREDSESTKIPTFLHTYLPCAATENLPENKVACHDDEVKCVTPEQTEIFPSNDLPSCSVTSAIYEPISPVHLEMKYSPQNAISFSTTNIQSSKISSSAEMPVPSGTNNPKPQIRSAKRKLSEMDMSEAGSAYCRRKRSRHNEPLNQQAIMVMTEWYDENKDNPYPSKDEKAKMAEQGSITVSQVKSWFANKRNRTNNTRPKVQKQQLQNRLLTLCHSLAKDQQNVMDNSFVIQQLSTLISSAKQ